MRCVATNLPKSRWRSEDEVREGKALQTWVARYERQPIGRGRSQLEDLGKGIMEVTSDESATQEGITETEKMITNAKLPDQTASRHTEQEGKNRNGASRRIKRTSGKESNKRRNNMQGEKDTENHHAPDPAEEKLESMNGADKPDERSNPIIAKNGRNMFIPEPEELLRIQMKMQTKGIPFQDMRGRPVSHHKMRDTLTHPKEECHKNTWT